MHTQTVNKLIPGDNLEILKQHGSESVDLVYLAPFFSNRNDEVIWRDAGEVRSFQDRWSGGIYKVISRTKKVLENDGLENSEFFTLKVNGGAERRP